MSACEIFDVEIRDMTRYQEFTKGVELALDSAGARCGETCHGLEDLRDACSSARLVSVEGLE